MALTHSPGRLPQIGLDGRSFYIRSGSLKHDAKTKAYSDTFSLTRKRRRLIGSRPRSWSFTIAARSWEDRLALETILTETPSSYKVEFEDGLGNTYDVTIDSFSPMTPVVDNTDYWDIGNVTVVEWV